VSQASEVHAARWGELGYTRPEKPTLGRSRYPHSLFVHWVAWWKPAKSTAWDSDAAIWLCGNQSHQAIQVTEVPERMQMCRACEKRMR
jgi:hypothetical protein